jgi:outer membrane protein insertion porin family
MMLWLRLFRGLWLVGLVLGGCTFGAAISAVATADSAWAQGSEQIVVQGNRRVEAETVRSYFRSTSGRLDTATIDEALKALYGTGLFQDVRITPSGNRLIVTVVENPVINRIAFEGNKKLKDEQLLLELQSKPRGALSRPAVQSDVQRLVEIYRRNGRFDVTVNPKIIELPNNRVDLVFEVNEGTKTGIRKLIFVGNNSYSDTRLKDEIKTSETIPFIGFLQTADIYDPDRIEADRDLLRRFYLKKGYADVRIVSAVAVYDPAQKGFIVTFTIDEGQRYRYGKVEIISHVTAVDANSLYGRLRASPGGVYNAEATEKSVENLAIEVARRGYPFAVVRPRGDRDAENARINIAFVIDDGPRVYIERINVRGNTRTRDYVIRREFDIAEGDAYNRALIDRAERRLKNLNYFKVVKFTNEPGSASDRIVINVDVEEQATGEFSVTGGYSTADGFLAEVSVAERNLLGHGQYAKASVQYGQRARGFELSYAEPYFMGNRMLVGIDVFARQTLASSYYSYDNKTIGAGTRLGFLLTEETSFMARYNIYQQEISLPYYLNDCIFSPNAIINGGLGVNQANEAARFDPALLFAPYTGGCYANGESSLAVRKELSQGPVVVSMVGYTAVYNTLDNNRAPTSGIVLEFKQDFAGIGGDIKFIRTTGSLRSYYEMFADVVAVVNLQGGHIAGWGNQDPLDGSSLRMLDHFQMGPNLVRGFAPAGIGPRDMASPSQDALGGSMYWGASVEAQSPIPYIPRDIGLKVAAFADAGSLWDYKGPRAWAVTGERVSGCAPTVNAAGMIVVNQCDVSDGMDVRASVGVGLIWNSPFGPLRFDYAVPLLKQDQDKVQRFRFGGGTKF